MKNIVIGMLAHVDAGKTTLSEGLLYKASVIRRAGRVDNQDTFFDTDKMERARGITIFSKQARIVTDEGVYTLLDTPGHVDFSAEMERTLAVLDYAVLVISGSDGVQAHTKTVWKLLNQYNVPTFIYVNKMDMPGTDKVQLFDELSKQISGCIIDFTGVDCQNISANDYYESAKLFGGDAGGQAEFFENLAMCDEECMEEFMENGSIDYKTIVSAIKKRRIFPCMFGSALRMEGVEEFLNLLRTHTVMGEYKETFGARVLKITRDEQDNRLTHLKITGGTLKVKQELMEEKVNQIRLYNGTKFETTAEASQGCVCAVMGLTGTYPGQGIGSCVGDISAMLEPVLNYKITLPREVSPSQMLLKLKELEEEEPELGVTWDEELKELHVKLMGEVQTEVLANILLERYDVRVSFDEGKVLYKETINNTVEGVGHFEPLRHYAEVHLILEPGPKGSGIKIETNCREEVLEKNWQRLIVTHLNERKHLGVLTGSPITDVKITLASGRAHNKHTEGGDFRQATYRAVRQGLMQAESVLLEPYYTFTIDVPTSLIGRVMTDVERMCGTCTPTETYGDRTTLVGRAPVITMRNYQKEINAYSHGEGTITFLPDGYDVCHNPEEVVDRLHYDPDADTRNPAASVFCAHGSGFIVTWDQVFDYMHIDAMLLEDGNIRDESEEIFTLKAPTLSSGEPIGTEEVDAIIGKLLYSNSHDKDAVKRWGTKKTELKQVVDYSAGAKGRPSDRNSGNGLGSGSGHGLGGNSGKGPQKDKYLLVDGYNIIFAWEELNDIAQVNIDGARGRLLDIMCNYQGIKKVNLIVVFDAYRVKGHDTEYLDYHNIHVVYTKEAETADRYIERFAHENASKFDVMVATSDGLEQIIIRGAGCHLISAREFEKEVKDSIAAMQENYIANKTSDKNYIGDIIGADILDNIEE